MSWHIVDAQLKKQLFFFFFFDRMNQVFYENLFAQSTLLGVQSGEQRYCLVKTRKHKIFTIASNKETTSKYEIDGKN